MASRGAFGFRSAKPADKADERGRTATDPGRRASITSSAASNTSKQSGQSTSFFSRSKSRGRTDPTRTTTPSSIPVGKTQSTEQLSSTISEPGRNKMGTSRSVGLGTSTSSQASTAQSPKSGKSGRNVLRRKAPLDQRGRYAQSESSTSSHGQAPSRSLLDTASSTEAYQDPFAEAVLGITMPPVSSTPATNLPPGLGSSPESATSSSRMASYNPPAPPQALSTQNLPPPTPTFAHDSGSSTRRSESPGAFSRTSTPTSMSSASPGMGTPAKTPFRRQMSPTRSRPPVTRRKFPNAQHPEGTHLTQRAGLPSVRESLTSSSSSSTVKAAERRDGSQPRSDRSTPLPPSPPARQSSRGFAQQRSDDVGRRRDILLDLPEKPSQDFSSTQRPQIEVYTQSSTSHVNRYRTPPPRPSREGTPRLDSAFEPETVIHTRLPPLQTAGFKGRSSLDKESSSAESRSAASHSSRANVGRSPSSASSLSVKPSRMPSPNPRVTRPLRVAPEESSRSLEAPFAETNVGGASSNKDPSPLSASPSKSSHRFGLFTKRTKSPLDTTPYEGAAKKGPAAGTGHEGYGKGRSTSANSVGRTSSSRKSSVNSRDDPEMDVFLRERLAPVVISGGGHPADVSNSSSAFYPTSSGTSSVAMAPKEDVYGGGPPTLLQNPLGSNTFSTEPASTHHLRRDHRRLPHRHDNPEYAFEQQQRRNPDQSGGMPSLAARRSQHRSQVFGEEVEPLKLPAPIDTRAVSASPFLDSRDALQDSVPMDPGEDMSEGHEGSWLTSRRTEKQIRSPKKWNFFQRPQASPRRAPASVVPRFDDDQVSVRELPATVTRLPEARSVAFYQLLDGSQQDLNQINSSREADRARFDSNNSSVQNSAVSPDTPKRREYGLSALLPSPPKLSGEFPRSNSPLSQPALVRPPETFAEATPARVPEPTRPRLQQVGRIPRVVSKRDRLHKPPPQSFSRPFARPSTASPEEQSSDFPIVGSEHRFFETIQRQTLGIQTEIIPSDSWGSQDSGQPASAPVHPNENFSSNNEFLAFPPRISSEVSGSSNSAILGSYGTTAVLPRTGTLPDEDEVWNEYNEFLDTVGSSPAQLSNESRDPHEMSFRRARYTPSPLKITKEPSLSGSPENENPNQYSRSDPPTRPLPSPPDRSKFSTSELPSTPGTISDFVAGYGERNRSSAVKKMRESRSTTSRYSTSSIETDVDSQIARENSQSTKTAELSTQSNLRFDALMTSRWLSFDRVLFSPAHEEVRGDRILVLDGLGNDDWSYYCAETYRDAAIFNLSPTPSRPQQQTLALHLPQNHRQIQHLNLGNRFPFPPGFFAAAVLRFPLATSEGAYLNATLECMRVLRPGGHLEMSILDLDMVNMGHKARKALRELKVRMQVAQSGVALKPLIDNIQKMVKRSGFENLNRCMVNIPVAGPVSNSRSGSMDLNSKSLEDLRKESQGKGDGGLAKSLSTVGRWWHTRCYEMVSLPYDDTERSIWNDKALLEECEKRETGFKLLLCYAQKPADHFSRSGFTSKATTSDSRPRR
ncbi:hypothetical protein N7G274_009926 [Stereocaulon virgatum]|uniref:Methyltransferase type 11 domain-containing protein n=1 Tax=Stereocaulon virgatum TaxID=373712 RepID=A0ABR3ZXJ7_9LECA